MSFSFIRAAFVTRRSPQPSDIESQVQSHSEPVQITGTYTATPLPPLTRAFTIASERPAKPSLPSSDAIDDFFGAARTTRTSDSRHDERPTPSSPPMVTALPPAYPLPVPLHTDPAFDESELPSYSQLEATHARQSVSAEPEPITLAQYFFKFDFIFPPLWFLSVFILFSPRSAPADWETTKTLAERDALLDTMRKAESKWARRSIAAAALLSVMITAIVTIAVSLSRT